jgi:hypothetical protein
MTTGPDLMLHTKVHSKQMKDIKQRANKTKPFEENIEKNLHNL